MSAPTLLGPEPTLLVPREKRRPGIDHYVRAFETAWTGSQPVAMAEFLPPRDDPAFGEVVLELIRVDLELGWEAGHPNDIEDYRRAFPEVLDGSAALTTVAFEEYRQRREHGQEPDPAEYAGKYGIDTRDWPVAEPGLNGLIAASLLYRERAGDGLEVQTAVAPGAADDARELLRAIHHADPSAARRLADAALDLPDLGQDFEGFRLEAELGRGAFGRVFLARQLGLAERPVALKVTAVTSLDGSHVDESQTLAQLQHTNIVPVHSVHTSGSLIAVCMPYFGSTTLADVIRGLRSCASLPASGRHLISTVIDRKMSTVRSKPNGEPPSDLPASADSKTSSCVQAGTQTRPQQGNANILLDRFAGQNYCEAVLWLGARVADGLAHAHDRGIIHRDLKPANVLLSDDGQPMLLDFNLAEDTQLRSSALAARIGGTLPYMSPEQLAAFRTGRPSLIDARTDIYSLGLVLFELLTGRPAFPARRGPLKDSLPAMLADRQQLPRLIPLNPSITRATEAIVRKCLEPEPERRYASARALSEDIERHLSHQPLRHVREPSIRERARKWVRRHPRLASWTTAGAMTTAALIAVAVWAWTHGYELRRLTAEKQAVALASARNAQQALLNSVLNSAARGDYRQSANLARSALAAYGVPDNPHWRDGPLVASLTPDEQKRLADRVGGVLLTWAEAEQRWAEGERGDQKQQALVRAWRLTDEAAACLNDGGQSLAVWRQRAVLAGELGREDYGTLAAKAEQLTPRSAEDHYYLARALTRRHELRKAIGHLLKATELDPTHFWARIDLGSCYYDLGDTAQAIAAYGACVGMARDPAQAYFAYYHRGMVFKTQGAHAAAIADLEHALEQVSSLPADLARGERPKLSLLLAEVLMDRGKLLSKPADLAAAEAVLTEALAANGDVLRLYLLRAEVRTARADTTGANQDWQELIKLEPADERDWTLRGLARLKQGDANAALADFNRALALNPTFYLALQNKAHVLSVRLNKDDEAVAVLNCLVELYPDYVKARIGRGVLLARQGKRTEAHADAAESLARDRSGETLYMAANIYALTSKVEPADAGRVSPLLAASLLSGFGFDEVDDDPDMTAVRGQPWFRQVVQVAREIRKEVSARVPTN